MRIDFTAALAAALLCLSAATWAADAPPESPEEQRAIAEFRASLHPQHGDVAIMAASATLHLGERYYFLPAADAKRVLVRAWGNPADSVDDVLGMVFREGADFNDDNVWAAIVTYRDTGYISDGDAKSMDYDALLREGRAGEDEDNRERKSAGLPSVHL